MLTDFAVKRDRERFFISVMDRWLPDCGLQVLEDQPEMATRVTLIASQNMTGERLTSVP